MIEGADPAVMMTSVMISPPAANTSPRPASIWLTVLICKRLARSFRWERRRQKIGELSGGLIVWLGVAIDRVGALLHRGDDLSAHLLRGK